MFTSSSLPFCFRRALDDAPMSPSIIGESELKHELKDTKMVRRAEMLEC